MENYTCPHCGNTRDFIEGKQNSYSNIWFGFLKARIPRHIICLNCGTIVRSYIPKVEKLKPKESKYDL